MRASITNVPRDRQQGRVMCEDLSLEALALNDNGVEPSALERRSFSDPERAPSGRRELSPVEVAALDLLCCGLSFTDAADISGAPLDEVTALWKDLQGRRHWTALALRGSLPAPGVR